MKLQSEKLTEIQQKIAELKSQLEQAEQQEYEEKTRIFCEIEGLVSGESIIASKGKRYVFSHPARNIEYSRYQYRNGNWSCPGIFGYLILKSGKISTSLTEIHGYDKWEKE